MSDYVIYNTTTGRITKALTVIDANDTASVPANVGVGEASLAASGLPETHYVTGGASVIRPDLDTVCSLTNAGGWTANGTDTITYGSALPNPTKVRVSCDNPRFTQISDASITDGTLTLTTTAAGEYTIMLESFPYATKILTVTAS